MKQHDMSKWHIDAIVTAAMAKQAQQQDVIELQCASVAKEIAEQKMRNCEIIIKLLRSIYFLVKSRIPYSTTYKELIELQVVNGDMLLQKYISEGPSNAQYTSRFSATMLIEAIDTWLQRKIIRSLQLSSVFSILADKCQDISTQEELSICGRWLVHGRPEEHFLTVLHVRSTDAATITEALQSFISQNQIDVNRMIGQGYDGAATFAGKVSGVYKRMQTLAAHAIYIHCSCHRLQLASIQAAESVIAIKKMFGTMTTLWKFFYYSPKKAEALKSIQTVLNLPELKVVKPSTTRWLSHERCIQAICKELPALIVTLQQLYESSGDAEAYGIVNLLSSITAISSIFLLSDVLNILARLNLFMQKKATDFSKLPIMLSCTLEELKSLRYSEASWCTSAESAISSLETEHGITVKSRTGPNRAATAISSIEEFRVHVAIPYIDQLMTNMNDRFSDEVVKLVVSSVFNPSLLPDNESLLPSYGNSQVQDLADFYGNEATIVFEGTSYTSPAVVNKDELLLEWPTFKRAIFQEKKSMLQSKNSVSMQEIKKEMEASFLAIFPETFKLMDILLALPIGTATVERSFSQMKMIKTRLRNRLSDVNLARLMRIAIEGPELSTIDFKEILDVFKECNRRIQL